jgi:cell division transport system permease protein
MISAWVSAQFRAMEQVRIHFLMQPFAAALSIVVIGIAILLPLCLYVFFENLSAAAARLDADPNINIYLQIGANESDTKQVAKRIKGIQNSGTVKFLSREQALAEMRRFGGVSDLLSSLDTNPLPNAFSVRPNSTDPSILEAMRAEIAAIPKVEVVVMDFEWAQKLRRFANFAERIVAILAFVLALAVSFVIGNTIRLQMLTQKDEIDVSRLIGATHNFIRRPFLYYGALQGLLASFVALATLAALVEWSRMEVQALTITYGSDFNLILLSPQQTVWVLIGAMALGWVGAFLSVSIYLKQKPKA